MSYPTPQQFSHYPAWPAPLDVPLVTIPGNGFWLPTKGDEA